MAMDAREIERMIKESLPDAVVQIRDLAGDGDNYAATVVSAAFKGKTRVQQHQLVYAALKGNMPKYKYIGNKVLTFMENKLIGTKLSEFHSGYRAYSVHALRKLPLGTAYAVWTGIGAVGTVILGIVLFGEPVQGIARQPPRDEHARHQRRSSSTARAAL